MTLCQATVVMSSQSKWQILRSVVSILRHKKRIFG